MKKLKLLTVTGLMLAGLTGQTLSAQAATVTQNQLLPNGGRVIVAYGSNCDISNLQSIFERFESCFPTLNFPDCGLPGGNLPGCNAPDFEVPDVETPENNTPESTPGTTPDSTPDVAPDAAPDFTPDSNPDSSPEIEIPEAEHTFIKKVVNLVNLERAKEGLSPLTIDVNVQAAAMVRAKECEQSFSHTRPNGSSFVTALKEQNVSYQRAGENIAWGQRSPEEVMKAWMNSSGHRANIMNPGFTTIGVGYYENAKGTDYWCQLFTR